MRKSLVPVAALLALCGLAAHATPPTVPPGHNYHGGTANQTVQQTLGITNINASTAAAASRSASGAWSAGGSASASGGLGQGGSASVGNVLAGGVDLAGARIGSGDTYHPRQTPPSYAPQGDKPRTSCRLFLGGGAASPGGSASGAIPIGNDAVCLHEKRDAVMTAANTRRPGTFGDDDFLRNDCTVEGMADTAPCKALAQRDQQRASSASARTTTASLDLLP